MLLLELQNFTAKECVKTAGWLLLIWLPQAWTANFTDYIQFWRKILVILVQYKFVKALKHLQVPLKVARLIFLLTSLSTTVFLVQQRSFWLVLATKFVLLNTKFSNFVAEKISLQCRAYEKASKLQQLWFTVKSSLDKKLSSLTELVFFSAVLKLLS